MNLTAHSDIGKIHTIFIKHAREAFIDDVHISAFWKSLNFLDKPDFDNALLEYDHFESMLKRANPNILYLPKSEAVNMDSVYCRDASIATNGGMIICNMGKAERKNEPLAEREAFEKNGIAILGSITAPGTLEGGDVAWLDENTLAVGHTYRTNQEGIRQLTKLLKPLDVEVIPVPLPHYKGPSDVFHLMSIFSPVDLNLAVVYSSLMPIVFRDLLIRRNYQLVEVPDSEFETMGCNVLALAPRECLMVEGNPVVQNALEDAGCVVNFYRGNDISVKGGGGPTCLTRPVYRYK